MAFDESPRFRPVTSQTGTNLGPNYYCVVEIPDEKQNYVPFISKSERKYEMGHNLWTSALYNPKVPRKIIGGSSMLNRSPRMIKNTKAINDIEEAQISLAKTLTHIELKRQRRRPRKLYVCKVPFCMEAKGPSVPSQIDENGYSYDENMKLIKNPPDRNDLSLGPAYYNVNKQNLMNSKELYGGCRWSASKTPRKTVEPLNDHPGPGSYNLANESRHYDDSSAERYREMARMFSFAPRTLDIIQKQAVREDLPGPAAYNLQRSQVPKRINTRSAFSTSADRFHQETNQTPAPSDYDLHGSVEVKRVSRTKGVFVFKSERFPGSNASKMKAPGPASYDIARGPKQDKRLTYKTVAFNVGTNRLKDNVDPYLPGPSDYYPVKKPETDEKSSIFKSRNPRFKTSKTNTFQTANPASYNISQTFNNLRNRKSCAAVEVGFQSKTLRRTFTPKDGPSPCNYNAHSDMPYKGYYMAVHPRFEHDDNGLPGPGSYTIQQSLDSSIYKSVATFNIKLKEKVLGAKLRLAPSDTRDEWNRERVKRKLLKVFDRPEIQIMESWMDL